MKPKDLLSRISSWPKAPTRREPAAEEENLPRVVIEEVTPKVNDGRYAPKYTVGSQVTVGVDIFKDGHDLILARVLVRAPGQQRPRPIPLTFDFDGDRWHASFEVDALGIWDFSVEAWPDWFGTWKRDLQKRLDAGQDVRSELRVGAAMLRRKAQGVGGELAVRLEEYAEALTADELEVEEQVRQALDPELSDAMYGPLDPDDSTTSEHWYPLVVDRRQATFSAWYEMFPRSLGPEGRHGTFRDAALRLPELARLGFDVAYLPPIHPIGLKHRKGRNNARTAEPGDVGSPWAIGAFAGGHTSVHPELGTLDDFRRFVRTAREHGLEIALDYALQCSPDHPWTREHPDWFFVRPDGNIRYAENPPKKYEDIYPINFWCEDRVGLWTACRDIFMFWIEAGVTIFRVDNPHTKPLAFWEWVIREVRRKHPEVLFLSEAFTRPKRMYGLAKLGFSQSYTYFTWKNTKRELIDLMTELAHTDVANWYRPNFFANTPDILHEYLQKGGRPAFRIRLILAATLSPAYGIYSGYELCENVPLREGSEEYLNSEKYEIRRRDFWAPGNLNHEIATINRIRREQSALHTIQNLQFIETGSEHFIGYRRYAPGSELLIVVNVDPHQAHETMITLPLEDLGIEEDESFAVIDLLTGTSYTWRGKQNYVRLDPEKEVAHVFLVQRRSAKAEVSA